MQEDTIMTNKEKALALINTFASGDTEKAKELLAPGYIQLHNQMVASAKVVKYAHEHYPQYLLGCMIAGLFSYPLTALAVALSVKLFKKRSVLSLSVGMTVGCLLSYTCGTLYCMAIGGVSLGAALASCVVPFIWFDVLKIVFCTALGTLVGRRMEKNI